MTVRLNRKTFRHGESLEVSIAPTQPMYVSVFQWLPYEKSPKQVSRIFPNPFDRENLFQTAGTVPTEKGRRAYEMAIGFPEALMAKKNLVDEYLMIVATRTPIKFRKIYALDEFKTRLLENPQGRIGAKSERPTTS